MAERLLTYDPYADPPLLVRPEERLVLSTSQRFHLETFTRRFEDDSEPGVITRTEGHLRYQVSPQPAGDWYALVNIDRSPNLLSHRDPGLATLVLGGLDLTHPADIDRNSFGLVAGIEGIAMLSPYLIVRGVPERLHELARAGIAIGRGRAKPWLSPGASAYRLGAMLLDPLLLARLRTRIRAALARAGRSEAA